MGGELSRRPRRRRYRPRVRVSVPISCRFRAPRRRGRRGPHRAARTD